MDIHVIDHTTVQVSTDVQRVCDVVPDYQEQRYIERPQKPITTNNILR